MIKSFLLTIMHPNGASAELNQDINSLLNSSHVTDEKKELSYSQFHVELQNRESTEQVLKLLSIKYQIDFCLIPEAFARRKKLLFIFDMDSTLVAAEVINVLADLHGVGEKVKEITKLAMNGGLSFDESLKRRLAMLKGMDKTQLKLVHERLPLSPGVDKFMKRAHALGHKTAIVSGGFNFFADDLKSNLGMHHAYSNELEFIDNKLTGNVIGPIVNAEMKERLVDTISHLENLTPSDVVAVGDGANDLLMLAHAHMGVAFHAKQTVRDQAKFHINYGGMDNLLYYLGIQE